MLTLDISKYKSDMVKKKKICITIFEINTLIIFVILKQKVQQFRVFDTFSFDFMTTVWLCPSCSIGYVWPFMELQLTAPSALAPTQDIQGYWGAGLDRNYTGNPLILTR